MLVVERWILARLRNQRFFSLAEANRAIAALLADLNQRPFKKLPGCRHSAFVETRSPGAPPAAAHRYEFAEWKTARVGIDYHVEVAGHYYSVPYRFARQEVDVRFTATTVEIFHRGSASPRMRSCQRAAHHHRCAYDAGASASRAAGMPNACSTGRRGSAADTRATVQVHAGPRKHPQQSYRACLGVLRMGATYSNHEAGSRLRPCAALNAANYRSVSPSSRMGWTNPAGDRHTTHPCRSRTARCAVPSITTNHPRRNSMFNHPTYQQLNQLRLFGMARA